MSEKTIAIVDDEEELRENLRDLLEFKGYGVEVYATGEELLERLTDINVDLVLLDIQLPGIDGLEVLKQLKEVHPHIPVAMVSASSVRSVLADAEKNKADRIILKPYSQQEMLAAVEELTANKPATNGIV